MSMDIGILSKVDPGYFDKLDKGAFGGWLSPAFLISLVIIVLSILAGYKRGFIKTVFDLAGMVVGVILTVLIAPYVASMIRNNPSMYNSIHSKIEEHVRVNFSASGDSLSDYFNDSGIPDSVNDFLQDGGGKLQGVADRSITAVNEGIADKVTDIVIKCIAFIGTLIVVMLIITIITMILNLISKLPGINTLNKTLGVAAGIFEAYLILSVIGVIIMAISTTESGIAINSQIAANPLLSFIYRHNIILIIMTKLKGL